MNRRWRRSCQSALALGLGEAAEADEVVALDAVEVVLGLRVHHPEHRVGVRLAHHMRDAPVVAGDRHPGRLSFPAGEVGGGGPVRGGGRDAGGQRCRGDGQRGRAADHPAAARAGVLCLLVLPCLLVLLVLLGLLCLICVTHEVFHLRQGRAGRGNVSTVRRVETKKLPGDDQQCGRDPSLPIPSHPLTLAERCRRRPA